MQHRILQYALRSLFADKSTEDVLLDMLDAISTLCCEQVDVDAWDEQIEGMEHIMIRFESAFPELMVSLLS